MSVLNSGVDLVVEVGGDHSHFRMRLDWDKGAEKAHKWKRAMHGTLEQYGVASSGEKTFWVKCDFLKVKEYVLLIFQSYGMTTYPSEMEERVRSWLDNREVGAITETTNFFNSSIWDAIKENQGPFARDNHQEEESPKGELFPYGAKLAVRVDNDYDKRRLIERIKKNYNDCTLLESSEIREISFKLEKELSMNARVEIDRIGSLSVALIYPANVGDREALEEKAKEWFPNAYYLPNERVEDLKYVVLNQPLILKLLTRLRQFV